MTLDLFLTIVAICTIVVTASVAYVSYMLVLILRKATLTLDLIEDTANDINFVKNGLKTGLLTLASGFIDHLQRKGGES